MTEIVFRTQMKKEADDFKIKLKQKYRASPLFLSTDTFYLHMTKAYSSSN